METLIFTVHVPAASTASLHWLLCMLLQLLPMALLYMVTFHGPTLSLGPAAIIRKEYCGPQVCMYVVFICESV